MGYVWQLLTFQFLHADEIHLFFNLIAIFFFGRPMEEHLGRGRFLALVPRGWRRGRSVPGRLRPALAHLLRRQRRGRLRGRFGLIAAFATLSPIAR
jgi:hypothetical protein